MKPIIPFSSKIQKRHETLTKRRYFYPALFLDFALWIVVALVLFSTNPDLVASKIVFFLCFFLALFLFLSLLFDNSRRGLRLSLATSFFLILRVLGVGTMVNGLLIVALVVATEMYVKNT